VNDRVLFIGSKPIGLKFVQELAAIDLGRIVGILTIDDRGDCRSAFAEIGDFARVKTIPLHVAASRKESEETIAKIAPDICFVVGWYWLVSESLIQSVPGGFVGVHNSLLPKYRGGAPLVWAMIRGEKTVGFSMFSFTPGMDDGPLWWQKAVPVLQSDYIADICGKIETLLIGGLGKVYQEIIAGTRTPRTQPAHGATYCARRTAEDGRIDWQWPCARIYDFIRAQSRPYPGAYTMLDNRKLTVWRATPTDIVYCGTPGQVVKIDEAGAYVATGDDHPIVLNEVGCEGRDAPAGEILRSITVRLG